MTVLQQLQEQGQQVIENWGEQKDRNLYLTRQVFEKFDPENKIAALLTESGYVHHPAVIEFVLNIGRTLGEGGFIKTAPPSKQHKPSLAEILYGDTHPTK